LRLLLDEMISAAVARGLGALGHDVEAIKRDRPELEGLNDQELVSRMATDQRAIVTNGIGDFQPIHDRVVGRGGEHYGMLFTTDATLPRDKANIPTWVATLAAFLEEHEDDAAMRNRVALLHPGRT
jgi:hypothetical protein